MKLETLRDLFVDELKDLYSAEHQLLKALPKMAKAAGTEKRVEGVWGRGASSPPTPKTTAAQPLH